MEGSKTVKQVGLFLGPLLFVGIQLFQTDALTPEAWKVLSLAAWMVIWWITEAIPIPATAILPMVVFPLMGIFSIGESTVNYANPIIFLFMGGFMIALALERHNLHKRIALNLIRITGTNANGIILGFMISTAMLSMWISNTATAVMMLPIAVSVVDLLRKQQNITQKPEEISNKSPFGAFALALFLGIAYSANIGGTATIIGTPPNVVFVGYVHEFYDYTVEFNTWLLIGLPVGIIMIALTYFLLTKVLFPNRLGKIQGASEIIRNHLQELGKISKEEKLVALVFALTAFAWIFKNPINKIIGIDIMNDTITAMAGGLLMFIIPTNWKENTYILEWKDMKRLPWGILILFGGGIALAKGMETTGIIQLIGQSISETDFLTGWLLILALTTVMLFMTELMSNVALTTIFIPVVFGIADGLGENPLLLSIPVTLAASCAFMMPISTPPNAIVFASGYIRIKDMIKAGFVLNIVAIVVLVILSKTNFEWVYGAWPVGE